MLLVEYQHLNGLYLQASAWGQKVKEKATEVKSKAEEGTLWTDMSSSAQNWATKVWGEFKTHLNQPRLPAGMGTWPKLADRSVWAHGNTRKGGEKKRKRPTLTGAEPGACAWESSATPAAPPIRPQGALSWFPFYVLRSGAPLPSAYCHVPILSGLLTLAMCPYRPGVWVA